MIFVIWVSREEDEQQPHSPVSFIAAPILHHSWPSQIIFSALFFWGEEEREFGGIYLVLGKIEIQNLDYGQLEKREDQESS